MAQNGYVSARIYTSRGQLPLIGAVMTVLSNESDPPRLLGKRTTDKNGLTTSVTVSAPDESLSESPGDITPFATVDIRIDHPDYYTVFINNAQVFANQTTLVDTGLVPLIENESPDSKNEEFTQTPQNL